MMQVCPVCNGRQKVPHDFYNFNTHSTSITAPTPQTCRTCGGTGMVALAFKERPFYPTDTAYSFNGHVPIWFRISGRTQV